MPIEVVEKSSASQISCRSSVHGRRLDMCSVFMDYFINIFQASPTLDIGHVVSKIDRRVSDEMNCRLDMCFTRSEVDVALA